MNQTQSILLADLIEMGEKIACGKDNWTSEKVEEAKQKEPKQEQPSKVPEKTEDKPSYKKWRM